MQDLNITDNELIEKIKLGDEKSASILVEKYSGFVESIAKKFYINGAEYEDIVQEAFIGFYEAVKSYKPGSLPFQNFAFFCIKKNIYDIIQAQKRQKRIPAKEIISLDASIHDVSRDVKLKVIDQIVYRKYINPEDVVIIKCLVREIVVLLSDLERKVLHGYLSGKSYEEISVETNKSIKAIGNALQRSRQKIKNYLLQEIKEVSK